MSLNKKLTPIVYILAVLCTSCAVLIAFRAQLSSAGYGRSGSGSTAITTVTATTSIIETTTTAYDAPDEMAEGEASSAYHGPESSDEDELSQYLTARIAESEQTAKTCRIILPFVSLFALFLLGVLLFFARRHKAFEGLELNLASLGLSAGIFISIFVRAGTYHERCTYDPYAVLNADSVIGPYDIAGAVIASLFFIWSVSTVVSWIFSKADLSFCLIWRITEKLKDSKKGIRNVIMIPGLFSLTCLIISAAALIYGIYRLSYQDYSFEWYNGFVLISFSAGMLLDLALSFYILSDRFRLIYTMQEEAVARAKTSERYRIDLVTNVSHDLRTPLTSIIGYGELLNRENLSQQGREDLARLNKKADYLRGMVDAVFELSKVSSGVLKCRSEELDLIRLLEQTIGYYDEEISAAQLQIRRHYQTETAPVVSDGIFLNQIFANLLTNAVKYAMKGTRVHIHVEKDSGNFTVRITNVASYEMKFDEKEILERFTRADEARNTEGSGLGLAIARTYAEALGGSFEVRTDGDQFSAITVIPEKNERNS